MSIVSSSSSRPENAVAQLEGHLFDSRHFTVRLLAHLAHVSGLSVPLTVQMLLIPTLLLLLTSSGRVVANGLLIIYPLLTTYVFPKEAAAPEHLMIYWALYSILTYCDRFLETVPGYYVIKILVLMSLFLEPCRLVETIRQALGCRRPIFDRSELNMLQSGRSPRPEKPEETIIHSPVDQHQVRSPAAQALRDAEDHVVSSVQGQKYTATQVDLRQWTRTPSSGKMKRMDYVVVRHEQTVPMPATPPLTPKCLFTSSPTLLLIPYPFEEPKIPSGLLSPMSEKASPLPGSDKSSSVSDCTSGCNTKSSMDASTQTSSSNLSTCSNEKTLPVPVASEEIKTARSISHLSTARSSGSKKRAPVGSVKKSPGCAYRKKYKLVKKDAVTQMTPPKEQSVGSDEKKQEDSTKTARFDCSKTSVQTVSNLDKKKTETSTKTARSGKKKKVKKENSTKTARSDCSKKSILTVKKPSNPVVCLEKSLPVPVPLIEQKEPVKKEDLIKTAPTVNNDLENDETSTKTARSDSNSSQNGSLDSKEPIKTADTQSTCSRESLIKSEYVPTVQTANSTTSLVLSTQSAVDLKGEKRFRGENPMAVSSAYQLKTDDARSPAQPEVNANDLLFHPSQTLVFNAPFDHFDTITYHMELMNNCQHTIAFAVKGNAIPRITAYPPLWVMPAGTKLRVAVSLKKFDYDPEQTRNDRISFEYLLLTKGDAKEFSHSLFQNSQIKRRKNIRIVYNL